MDLRVKKTKSAIINAFLTLRAQKPLEKITIKELAERAMINKATFYLHYRDVYDLSETMETDVVSRVIDNIQHPEYIFTDTETFVKELMESYFSQRTMIETIFSGGQMSHLPSKIEESVRKVAFVHNPELKNDLRYQMLLSYCIYGAYYAYMQNDGEDLYAVTEVIGKISAAARQAID